MKNLLSGLCSFALLAFAPATWGLVTITVTSPADNGPGSLRDAIAAAPSGATINFAVAGTIMLTNGELLITKDLAIVGPGPGNLTVQRSMASGIMDFRIFHVAVGNSLISGLTVINGRETLGGGIMNEDTLTLSNMVFIGNAVTNLSGLEGAGGGIYNTNNATMTVYNSVISTNQAQGGNFKGSGGGIYNAGTLTLLNSKIDANTSDGQQGGFGGGIYNFQTLVLDHSTVNGNFAIGKTGRLGAPAQGGGIYTVGSARLVLSTVSQNSATSGDGSAGDGGSSSGGGIFNGQFSTVLDRSTVSGNSATGGFGAFGNGGAAAGGGIANQGGNVSSVNSTLSGNSATGGASSGLFNGGLGEGGALINTDGAASTSPIIILSAAITWLAAVARCRARITGPPSPTRWARSCCSMRLSSATRLRSRRWMMVAGFSTWTTSNPETAFWLGIARPSMFSTATPRPSPPMAST